MQRIRRIRKFIEGTMPKQMRQLYTIALSERGGMWQNFFVLFIFLNVSQKILLLDVSHLFFRAFFALPKTMTDADGNAINAIFGVSSILLSLIGSEKPDYIFGAKDEKGKTRRHEVFPDYKGHRPEMPPELVSQLPKIFNIFDAFHIPLFSHEGLEADDILATISEMYRGNKDFDIEIVSGDHDIFQLVGENVVLGLPQSGGHPPLHLKREDVFQKLGVYPEQIPDYKGMVGDTSDNLKGVPGVGAKTASKLLQQYGTLESICHHAHEIPGAMGERIQKETKIALLTKEMTTLHRDLNLDGYTLEGGHISNIVPEELESFFRKFQFHSLINRLKKTFSPADMTDEEKEEDALWQELEEAKKTPLSSTSKVSSEKSDSQMELF